MSIRHSNGLHSGGVLIRPHRLRDPRAHATDMANLSEIQGTPVLSSNGITIRQSYGGVLETLHVIRTIR